MVQGIYELRCTRTAIVKELPPFQGLREYRAALEGREEVEEVRDEQRAESCLLVVRFREGKVPRDLAQYLQVTASLQESPAVLIGLNGKPRKYNNPGEILEEHLEARLKLYERRKEAVLARLQRNVELLSEKIRFIRDVLGGEFSLADSE
jgi:DNA topoisomerase-2